MILLDTCAFLWLTSGGSQLTQRAKDAIEQASEVCISSMSAFEISIKYHKGKLGLPLKPHEWFEAAIIHHDIIVMTLNWEICMLSTSLPPIHNDPCDRFIIATAQWHQCPIITADSKFKAYGVEVIF